MVTIREGEAADLAFVEQMLYAAFFWNGEPERPSLAEIRQRPEFASLLAGWGRPGDIALLAEHDGVGAGAVWCRTWTQAEHSYGFIDEQTPELGLGVLERWRGRGFGRALLRALVDTARLRGYPALSLSVAPENPARRLYESEGFVKVGEVGTSWTLRRGLSRP